MSWANIVKAAAPAETEQQATAPPPAAGPTTIAVVDTNAIINGTITDIQRIATSVVTISEVLDEVRDAKSREYLSSLPFTILTKEPSEEAVKTVLRFARETGDIHALSSADVKLLALALTLETEAHGSSHIREHPVQAKVKSKARRSRKQQLPGWGKVDNPEDWKVVDEASDEDDKPSASTAAGGVTGGAGTVSRIAAELTDLDIAAAAAASQEAGEGSAIAPSEANGGAHDEREEVDESEEDEEGDDQDEWATVGKSRNAERRRRRKQGQWEARQAAVVTEPGTGTASVATSVAGVPIGKGKGTSTAALPVLGEAGAVADSPSQKPESTQQGKVEEAEEEGDEEESSGDEGEEEEGEELEDSDSDEDGEEGEEGEGEGGQEEEGEEASSTAPPLSSSSPGGEDFKFNTTSTVMSITADFPMQNVLLQMGLRLVTRDGRQIARLSRWILRCHACFHMTKEGGTRMFCPKCGGMTMERVEVEVGPDGAEFYGVRKRHCLKGTRFSLPKPKGGRAGAVSNPILSEDVFMKQMGKKLRRRAKAAEGDVLDPFVPELATGEAWFKAQAAATGGKGAKFMMTGFKNNPNVAKHTRSTRRG